MQHDLKYIKRVKARGKEYLYFDTGATKDGKAVFKRLPDPKSREFGGAYAALLGHRNRRAGIKAQLTVKALIKLYQNSPEYRRLAKNSQRLYSHHLAKVEHEMGSAPAAKVESRDVALMMAKLGDKPATANLVLAVVGAVYSWARDATRQFVPGTCNPTCDVKQMEVGEHKPWPEHILFAALETASISGQSFQMVEYYAKLRDQGKLSAAAVLKWENVA